MGNIFKSILNRMNVDGMDDFDDDDDFDNYDSELVGRKENKKTERTKQTATTEETKVMNKESNRYATVSSKPQKSADEDKFEYELSEMRRDRTQRSASRVVPLRSSSSSSRVLEVSIMKPTRFDDSQDICDMLVNERATVVNLEGIDLALAQRIMDFVSGSVYALNGKIHQISGLIFIVSPENVDISGDYLSYVEQNGFEVPTLNH